MSRDLIDPTVWEMVLLAAGVIALVVALGARVLTPLTRRWLVAGGAGVALIVLSVVVGWRHESGDVDRLRAALQERGLTVSLDRAREARDALNDRGEYDSGSEEGPPWRLTVVGDRLELETF